MKQTVKLAKVCFCTGNNVSVPYVKIQQWALKVGTKGKNNACVHGSSNGTNGIPISFKFYQWYHWKYQWYHWKSPLVANISDDACVQGSTNDTNGIPILFKVLPMVPLVKPLVPLLMPMVPLLSQWYHW